MTFRFLNRDAISDQNMTSFICSRGSLENHIRFQTIVVKIISAFLTKRALKA